MLNKLKSLILDDTIYMALLLVLVGIGSFGLGKLSVTVPTNQSASVIKASGEASLATATAPLLLLSPATTTSAAPPEVTVVAQNFVASKSGTKYHALHCAGAKQIKETNKIFFASEEDAEAAGYTRAANCKF